MKVTRIIEGAFYISSNNIKCRNCGRRFGPRYYIAVGPRGGSHKICPECARILAAQHDLDIEPPLQNRGKRS